MKSLLITGLFLSLMAVACGDAQAQGLDSSMRNFPGGVRYCTMIAGIVHNPTTNQCRTYRNGCELAELRTQGYVVTATDKCLRN